MVPSQASAQGSRYTEDRIDWKAIAALVVMLVMFMLGLVMSGVAAGIPQQLRAFIVASIEVVPFVMLALLAYIGTRRDWGKVLTFIWLLFIIGGLAINNIGTAALARLDGPLPMVPGEPFPSFVPGGAAQIAVILGLSFLAVAASALGFVPAVRRWLSRFLPLDPQSFVHAVALVSVVAATLLSLIPLLVLQAPPTLEVINNQPNVGDALAQGSSTSSLIYRLVWAVPGAVFAVGYAVRRNLGGAFARLGFVRPTLGQVALGIGAALVLVALVTVGGLGIEWLWTQFGWPQTDAEAFEQLLGDLINPFGAVVIGVVAGISEELAIRGVLQPRLGILLSNVFFTSLHALQYNWDSLLVVFVVGLAFGILRQRTNTTTSAIAHGVYNFSSVMLQILLGSGGQ